MDTEAVNIFGDSFVKRPAVMRRIATGKAGWRAFCHNIRNRQFIITIPQQTGRHIIGHSQKA
jgi:hypothetical protein